MLIYNHKQEFIGIDEKDLKHLGFKNLAELQKECNDFADLFVKKPSYIHNFKNFNWIYYILHSDVNEAKVIISTKKNNFSASLELETIYLSDAPEQPAYAITLSKLRTLDGKESKDIEKDIEETPAPIITLKEDVVEESLPDLEDQQPIELSEPDIFDTPVQEKVIEDPYDFDFNAPLDIEDIYMPEEETTSEVEESFELDQMDHSESPINIYEESEAETEKEEQKVVAKPMLGDYTRADSSSNEYIDNLKVSKDYLYDPQVASNELGLPVDLIEEFIGDFIQQSYDFKNDLYNHVAENDFDGVKLLSHKLKGVAANLRIEDAFEVLSIINVSDNIDEVRANLDHFYKIIAKLEGKEIPESAPQSTTVTETENTLEDIKPQDDSIDIKEEEVADILPVDDDLYSGGIKYDDNEPITMENHNFDHQDDLADIGDPVILEDYNFEEDDDLIKNDEPISLEEDDFIPESKPVDLEEDDFNLEIKPIDFEEDDFDPEIKPVDLEEDDYLIKDDEMNAPKESEPELDDLYGKSFTDNNPEENVSVEEDNLDYDKTSTVNELGLDEEIVDQLLTEFKEQANEMIDSLETSIDNNDFATVKNLAISIKGASDNLRLSKVSKILEELISADNVETAKQSLISFKNYINQI